MFIQPFRSVPGIRQGRNVCYDRQVDAVIVRVQASAPLNLKIMMVKSKVLGDNALRMSQTVYAHTTTMPCAGPPHHIDPRCVGW